jgi:hypothetical protein
MKDEREGANGICKSTTTRGERKIMYGSLREKRNNGE